MIGLRCANSNAKIKRNMKKGNMTPPKVNNSTIIDYNDSEVDEISRNSNNKNDQEN
jgi:hypothetical protein